ncbi:MAG: RidA family protein [Actinomycetota bacterium]|nr:RidA family protein [Actinomycetota bacterium]
MADKVVIRTERAPAPFQGAPYSQAIRTGDLVFVSGQLAIDPETNELVGGGISEQTERVMQNLRAILEEAGSGLAQLVKTTIYLADLGDFAEMNEVYGRHVGPEPPARATIEVAALPQGALVEIEAVGHL